MLTTFGTNQLGKKNLSESLLSAPPGGVVLLRLYMYNCNYIATQHVDATIVSSSCQRHSIIFTPSSSLRLTAF